MKIRMGFVTNSSSSSFILGFKSKETVGEELLNDPVAEGHVEEIYRDCMKSGTDLKSILECVEWEEENLLDWDMGKNISWTEFEGLHNSNEYVKELNKKMAKFKEDAEGKTFFVDVSYEGEMEYSIAPYLQCCLRSYDHH